MRKKGTKNKKYSPEFKISVILDMREHHLGYREVTRKYDLSWHRAQSWERIYLEEGINGLMKDKRGRKSKSEPRKKPLDKQVEEDLIAENQRLRMEIEYLKKLRALVQERIERENGKKQK